MNIPIIRVRNTRRRNTANLKEMNIKNLLISKSLLRDKDSQSPGYLSFSNLVDERKIIRTFQFGKGLSIQKKKLQKSQYLKLDPSNICRLLLQYYYYFYYYYHINCICPFSQNVVAFIGRLQQPIIEMLKLEVQLLPFSLSIYYLPCSQYFDQESAS